MYKTKELTTLSTLLNLTELTFSPISGILQTDSSSIRCLLFTNGIIYSPLVFFVRQNPLQQSNLPLIQLFMDSVAALDAYNIGANE